jgi:hypothetical protein
MGNLTIPESGFGDFDESRVCSSTKIENTYKIIYFHSTLIVYHSLQRKDSLPGEKIPTIFSWTFSIRSKSKLENQKNEAISVFSILIWI